jgi:hypothetical protein
VNGLATPLLVLAFAGACAATWAAGIFLSKTTDALDVRFGLGEALGGLILLTITGSCRRSRSRRQRRSRATSTSPSAT